MRGLVLVRSTYWAYASTSATGNAFLRIDYIFVTAIGDCANWASTFTSAASNAAVIDFISHDLYTSYNTLLMFIGCSEYC